MPRRIAKFLYCCCCLTTAALAEQLPRLSGSWQPSSASPRVFDTADDLHSIARAARQPDSFTAKMWLKLARQVKADLAANVDWSAPYSGCDLDIYLRAWAFESSGGYANETRSDEQMQAALHTHPGQYPPRGAAVVAARLALYAALSREPGIPLPAGAPSSAQAAALSRHILLTWANHGFRANPQQYKSQQFKSKPPEFCGATPKDYVLTDVGLQVVRGVIQSVHAQDLLMSLHALSPPDLHSLNAFHAALFNIVRYDSNFDAEPQFRRPTSACELYSNHRAMHLLSMLAIARLLNNEHWFEQALVGHLPNMPPIAISWVEFFDHAIYGQHDKPIGCYANTGKTRPTSKPSFQTSRVAPGEIEDRYRNANPEQGIGYPMFTLQDLYETAFLLRNSGFDAFHYRGRHGQTIQLGTDYYACYAKAVGFGKTITRDNARACPNSEEYLGQNVNGVEGPTLMGAAQFPQDPLLASLRAAAQQQPDGQFPDAILFGRWLP